MTSSSTTPAHTRPANVPPSHEREARETRLAQALKANLKRRKAAPRPDAQAAE